MSTHPNFDNAQPVSIADFPIVLRFAGLHPNDLGRFKMHDKRTGGDLAHVDQASSELNEVLLAGPKWQEVIRAEVKEASARNLKSNIDALLAKSRKKEAAKVKEAGLCDPWQRCEGGPLREGILTVNKAWFGGTGQASWDAQKVAEFKAKAMAFLEEHFPDGQLRYASGHADEEAYHIHFVVAVWRERVTANRGCQILLQASMNPLLSNYEDAQTLAGEAFSEIGLKRGDRRAEALREAKAAQADLPEPRHHVPPSEWRKWELDAGAAKAREVVQAAAERSRIEAQAMIDEARVSGTAAIRKCRKRAIREAQQRKLAAERVAAASERRREVAAKATVKLEARVETARTSVTEAEGVHAEIVAKAEATIAAAGEASERLLSIRADALDHAAALATTRGELAVLTSQKAEIADAVREDIDRRDAVRGELTALEQSVTVARLAAAEARQDRHAEESTLATLLSQRRSEESLLALAEVKLRNVEQSVSVAEALARALMEGIELFARGVFQLVAGAAGAGSKMVWSEAAPSDKAERKVLGDRVKPAIAMIIRLAQTVDDAVQTVLAAERKVLARNADFVMGLRDDLDPDQRARLEDIRAAGQIQSSGSS